MANLCHMNRKKLGICNQKFSDDEQLSFHSTVDLDLLKNTQDDYIQSPEGSEIIDSAESQEGSKDGDCKIDNQDAGNSVLSNEEDGSNKFEKTYTRSREFPGLNVGPNSLLSDDTEHESSNLSHAE